MPTKEGNQPKKLRPKEWEDFRYLVAKKLAESDTARKVYGYYDVDEESVGKYILCLLTETGIEHFTGTNRFLGIDEQSGVLDAATEQPCSAETQLRDGNDELPAAALWSRLCDQSANVPERLNALQMLLTSDKDAAVSWVAHELTRTDLSEEWRNVLVFLAEDIHFPVSLRPQVGERLLVIATLLRQSTKAGTDKVVWSAMRRAFSLLPPDARCILPFLERQGSVDTRSVALRCIERLFEPAPPRNPRELEFVADRVKDFAFKFLDPDVFASGENAVIAQNAVCTLAALGDPRLGEAIRRVKSIERRWMNRQIRVRLERLLSGWRSRDRAIASHPAFKNIEEQLASLP